MACCCCRCSCSGGDGGCGSSCCEVPAAVTVTAGLGAWWRGGGGADRWAGGDGGSIDLLKLFKPSRQAGTGILQGRGSGFGT
jgi:hypothetical protein